MAIVCLVGHDLINEEGHHQSVFQSMQNVPIRMVSYGGSNHNITLVINQDHKKEALNKLHETLFS